MKVTESKLATGMAEEVQRLTAEVKRLKAELDKARAASLAIEVGILAWRDRNCMDEISHAILSDVAAAVREGIICEPLGSDPGAPLLAELAALRRVKEVAQKSYDHHQSLRKWEALGQSLAACDEAGKGTE